MPPAANTPDLRPQDPGSTETRQRIVETSLRLFAEHGFKGVSVRDISAAAGVNVAAISYHFGSKQGLYHTIFATVLDQDEAVFAEQMAGVDRLLARAGGDRTLLAAAVEGLVAGIVGRITTYEYAHWFSVLLARELALPSALFDLIYRRRAAPLLDLLTRLTAAAQGTAATSASARLTANLVYGQILNLVFARPILWRQMGWDGGYTPERVALLSRTLSDLISRAVGLGDCGPAGRDWIDEGGPR